MVKSLKDFLKAIPEDVRRVALSLAVSLSLICSALLVLSSYIDRLSPDDPSVMVAATDADTSSESIPSSAP